MKSRANCERRQRSIEARLDPSWHPERETPVLEGGKAVYKQPPDETARGVADVLAAGANIVGSCCGSTPEHTRAIRQAVAMSR